MDGTHKGPGPRLGTQLRGRLAPAYSARGRQRSTLFSVYSPRTDRDWILRGELAWMHFLLVESDPRVKAVDYAPSTHVIREGDVEFSTDFAALVTFRDGKSEYRQLVATAALHNLDRQSLREWETKVAMAERNGIRYVQYTEAEILANPQRIVNWQRVIAWLSAARGHPLPPLQVEISALLDARGCASLEAIQSLGAGALSACYVAAAFKGVQDGIYWADLDERPLNKNTSVKILRSADHEQGTLHGAQPST